MSTMDTWVEDHHQSRFLVQNLPYVLAEKGTFAALDIDKTTLEEQTLNRYAALGQGVHRKVRASLQSILRADTSLGHFLRDDAALKEEALVPRQKAEMHLPFDIGDYTDFLPALTMLKMSCTDIFRPGTQPPESMYNMPLGYHGRSSSVVVSGTPVRRPRGQFLVKEATAFRASQKLDFEVEFAAFIGKGIEHGIAIPVVEAEEHIFWRCAYERLVGKRYSKHRSDATGTVQRQELLYHHISMGRPIRRTGTTSDETRAIGKHSSPVDGATLMFDKHTSLLPYLQEARKDTVYDIPIDVFLEWDSQEYHLVQGNTKNILFRSPK
ncbi:fumarylacetoacetase [Cladophialophora bantiana CBS 173.52]|uniref:Fumarylacetoacetase n=1 Tax=Cladophialophora bantiana (strain ATCC 10958 / CBS 173.52 / CDC B-1940 / NIH 8579) TaxID=1442370 RepID=A0A0D2HJC4_CLAB1|nr:fumarylacetoacetase [Cladophialophora bantiana CBS 173.52]KIW93403.1 fumarylacetoacetase [Cladophialophora bantiana CBS 173.52]